MEEASDVLYLPGGFAISGTSVEGKKESDAMRFIGEIGSKTRPWGWKGKHESERDGKKKARTPQLIIQGFYLRKLRRDSVGAAFQSVRKLTNYVCAAPPESRLRAVAAQSCVRDS